MAQIPGNKEVTQAIRSVLQKAKLATKEANKLAAQRVARGNYSGAQSLIETAQAISAFRNEVLALNDRWKAIRSSGKGTKKKLKDTQTPLWQFYQPILKAIITLGGEATRKDIEGVLEEALTNTLEEGDFVKNSRGTPRWKVMVARAKKHMISEGFVGGENIRKWKITKKGEQAAKSGVKEK